MASLTKSPPPAVIVPSGRVPVGRNHSSVTFTSRGIIKTPPKKLHLLRICQGHFFMQGNEIEILLTTQT